MSLRCLGCGYYEGEVESEKPCDGGNGYEGHSFIEVDERGMAYSLTERAEKAEEDRVKELHERVKDLEDVVQRTRARLARVADQLSEHEYQELASILEDEPELPDYEEYGYEAWKTWFHTNAPEWIGVEDVLKELGRGEDEDE